MNFAFYLFYGFIQLKAEKDIRNHPGWPAP